jgi:hypothetical protein
MTTLQAVQLVGSIRVRNRKDYAHIQGDDGQIYFAHISRVRGQRGEIIPYDERCLVLNLGNAVIFSFFPGDSVKHGQHPLAFDIRART